MGLAPFSVIESITSRRDPQPEYEAMYLLMPTNQNVDRIIRDFAGNTKQYAAGHLFFVEGELLFPSYKNPFPLFSFLF